MMPTNDFKPGDAVTVTSGTFEAYGGTVASASDKMVFVKLLIFGRVTDPIPLATDILRPRTSEDKDPTGWR